MSSYFGRVGTTLHILGQEPGIGRCGSAVQPVSRVGREDLICGACWTSWSTTTETDVEFGVAASGEITLAIETYLARRLEVMPYDLYLRTEHWQRMRALAIDRYGNACVLCNRTPIDVHHRTYERRGRERLDDLIVLCFDCHARYHRIPA